MIEITRPQCKKPDALKSKKYNHPDNKFVLIEAGFDKCMYCESKISHSYYSDIEHIKPKSRFPEFEYAWENLGFVCAVCNGSKGDKFEEDIPFINPYEEDPEDHLIAVGSFIKHLQGSERGEFTINEIDLNRSALLGRRKEKLDRIEKAIDACFRSRHQQLRDNALKELMKEAEYDKEYSLCVKYLLRAHNILK